MQSAEFEAPRGMIVFGYVFAVLGGLFGLILAAVVISKPGSKHHGALTLIIAVVATVMGWVLKNSF